MAFDLIRPPEGSRYFGLLATLVAIIWVYPYVSKFDASGLIFTLLVVAIPIASIFSLTESRRERVICIVLAIPATLAILQEELGAAFVNPMVARTFPMLVYLYATVVIVRHVVQSKRVTLDTLLGAITGYLMIGYTWSVAYNMVEMTMPGSFHVNVPHELYGSEEPLNLLYFSFVTLTTLGYGDIVPIGEQARSLALLEAMTGVLYLAFLVARMVSLYEGRERPSGANTPE